MNIRQDCLLELLKENGHDYHFLDNYFPGINIYFFGSPGGVTLTESCLTTLESVDALSNFPIDNPMDQLNKVDEDCQC